MPDVRRAAVWLFVALCLIATVGCGGGGNTGGGNTGGAQPTLELPPATDSTSALVERILADIERTEETAPDADPSDVPMPESLRKYFDLSSFTVKRVERNDPVVNSVCAIAESAYSGEVVEGLIDVLLTKLRGRGGGKGIGVLVSAIGIGCKALGPKVSFELQFRDPAPTPTPPQSPIYRAGLNEEVLISLGARPILTIVVEDVRCLKTLAGWQAGLGRGFIGVRATITALADDQSYDEYFWTLDVDSSDIGRPAFNPDPRWSPPLGFGTLSVGEGVSGWIAFEVADPVDGFTVTYRGNPYSEAPVFYVPFDPCRPT